MHEATTALTDAVRARTQLRCDALQESLSGALDTVRAARHEAEELQHKHRLMDLSETDPDVRGGLAELDQKLGAVLREGGRAEENLHRMLRAAQELDEMEGRLP